MRNFFSFAGDVSSSGLSLFPSESACLLMCPLMEAEAKKEPMMPAGMLFSCLPFSLLCLRRSILRSIARIQAKVRRGPEGHQVMAGSSDVSRWCHRFRHQHCFLECRRGSFHIGPRWRPPSSLRTILFRSSQGSQDLTSVQLLQSPPPPLTLCLCVCVRALKFVESVFGWCRITLFWE
jgi:hypothetical protein